MIDTVKFVCDWLKFSEVVADQITMLRLSFIFVIFLSLNCFANESLSIQLMLENGYINEEDYAHYLYNKDKTTVKAPSRSLASDVKKKEILIIENEDIIIKSYWSLDRKGFGFE